MIKTFVFNRMAFHMTGPFRFISRGKGRILRPDDPMRAPYGLEIIENCLSCPHRADQLFCGLSPAATQSLAAITSPSVHPKGATLFVEGQPPRGVFILCQGKVKLSTTSIDGKTLITRISDSGDVLGLPATVTGKPYELTADVIESTQANFIARKDFLEFLAANGEVGVRVAQQLARIYQAAIAEVRTIGLGHSAAEKLARLLLDLSADRDKGTDELRIALTFTHEEIAQMIGTSRETVTRMLGAFKRKGLVDVKGATLILKNKQELQRLSGD